MAHDPLLEELILSITEQGLIAEQADLQKQLSLRGYNVPQATLSRKMKKLKLAKVNGFYQCVQKRPTHLPLILKINIAESGLIVLHTHPGNANALAAFFDQHYVNNFECGVIGTIAGDDTILMIIKSKDYLKSVLTMLKRDFAYLGGFLT